MKMRRMLVLGVLGGWILGTSTVSEGAPCDLATNPPDHALRWADWVSVEPPQPSSADSISITLGGCWPDSCTPNVIGGVVDGNRIDLDVLWDHPPGVACATVITPWSLAQSIGPLPPGSYTVYARLLNHPRVPSEYELATSFRVVDADADGDGVDDSVDRCPDTVAGAVVDDDGCSLAQLVPCAGPVSGGFWKNHGRYVSTLAKVSREFVVRGLITRAERSALMKPAALSDCGRRK